MNTPVLRYRSLSIGLHWLMLVLLIAVYAFIELRGIYAKGSPPRELMKEWHFMLGLTVLALVLVRLGARLAYATPAILPRPGKLQHLASRGMHLLLYLFMIGMPLAGWLILSAGGKPIPFFGLQLPALVAQNIDLSRQVKQLHETAGQVGYYLIGLHALAALFNHYVLRNNTLKRMWPWPVK